MQAGPGFEDDLAGLQIAARLPDMATRLDLQVDVDDAAVLLGVPGALHHHDRVGALGHRRARHDPDRLARPDRDVGRVRPPPARSSRRAAAPGASGCAPAVSAARTA